MDREVNIDSIRALEEEIKEHERAAIGLKRARNSLLNVSKLPPEVLGNVFRWNTILKGDFDGLEKGSHNFLLVCHHWFEVASRTPELWSFWGTVPDEWARWCHRSKTAPVDLVLLSGYGYDKSIFDAILRDALEDRATKDIIRRLHFASGDTGLMRTILDSLTLDCEEIRSSGIESMILQNQSMISMDVSDFFVRYRFPKLQCLKLRGCSILPWDHLTSRTSILTTLELDVGFPSLPPTTSQSLSILSSNPALRKVALRWRVVPDDGGGKSSSRVQLHHLKELRLHGGVRHVFNLLDQLDYPGNVNFLSLFLRGCDEMDVSQVIGPYLRDHIRRRDRAQDGLSFFVTSGYRTHRAPHVTLCVGDAGKTNFSDSAQQVGTFVDITALLNGKPPEVREKAVLDLVVWIPREEVVYFKTRSNAVATKDPCTQFPKIKALEFDYVDLSAAFPGPKLAGDPEGKIFHPLERVFLGHVNDDDWSPLVTFLARRVSSGNRLDTLVISDSPDIPPEVVEGIRGMVRELEIDHHSSPPLYLNIGPDPLQS